MENLVNNIYIEPPEFINPVKDSAGLMMRRRFGCLYFAYCRIWKYLNLSFISMSITQKSEPFFATFAIYDLKNGIKLTEDTPIDLNFDYTLSNLQHFV